MWSQVIYAFCGNPMPSPMKAVKRILRNLDQEVAERTQVKCLFQASKDIQSLNLANEDTAGSLTPVQEGFGGGVNERTCDTEVRSQIVFACVKNIFSP